MENFSPKLEEEYKPEPEQTNNICRCCLSVEKRMFNISNFVSHFLDLAGLKVSESDGLPPWVCHECAYLLQKAVRFKCKLLKANTMLCDYLMRCAPFPIDALDPELCKYAAPNLKEAHTLAFDNSGKSKAGFQKTLEHVKKPVESALDSIELVQPVKPETPEPEPLKIEFDSFSDYEDNITLEEFRYIGTEEVQNDVERFLREPTLSNLERLGPACADVVEAHLASISDCEERLSAYVACALSVAGLSLTSAAAAAHAQTLLMSAIQAADKRAQSWPLTERLLRGLALIKSEEKAPLRWHLPGCYAALAQAFPRPEFPAALRSTLRFFIASKLPALPQELREALQNHPVLIQH